MNEFFADQYNVSTDKVTRIDPSPFYFEPTSERISFYQMDMTYLNSTVYNSFRSPFQTDDSVHTVIYGGPKAAFCGLECGETNLVMMGKNGGLPDRSWNDTPFDPNAVTLLSYRPLDILSTGQFSVYWGRGNKVAVIGTDAAYGIGKQLYFTTLGVSPSIPIDFVQPGIGSYLLAISEDGTRVLYTTPGTDPNKTILHLWQVVLPTKDTPYSTTVLPTKVFTGGTQGTFFAGANFIPNDADHFIALDNAGIVRVDVNSGAATVLNPNINAKSIRLAVFSPDNQHVAVLTKDYNVEVLATGIS